MKVTRLGVGIYGKLARMARGVGHFLRWLGGAEPDLLSDPSDRAYYFGLGAVQLITAGVAAESLFIALVDVLKEPTLLAVALSVLWGGVILSLDRFLVLSMAGVRSLLRLFLLALPRFGLGLIVSVITATPLILKIFSPQIDAKLRILHKGTGILAQLHALSDVTAHNSSLQVARWLFFTLFLLISLMPLNLRVLMNLGPISAYEIAVKSRHEQAGLPEFSRLLDVLNLDPRDPGAIISSWEAHSASTSAVIGLSSAGPYSVDVRADGPHALIGGAVGSGKSELLRTVVASLAVVNRPDAMTFMLMDIQGGSTLEDFALLPHTVGMLTDLDAHLMWRVLQSFAAEMRRRELLLKTFGAIDTEEYAAIRDRLSAEAAADLVPMPRLLVLVDEFATLKRAFPEFVPQLVDIARRGRSLGIHLILATQTPSAAITADILANTNLRIALRELSFDDSFRVIDGDNACYIQASTPGRAYVRIGSRRLVPIQASTIDATEIRALAQAIAQATMRAGLSPQHRPWLPPLPATLLLSDLAVPDTAPLSPGHLAPVGYALDDFPAQQAQRVCAIDFASFRHLVAVGARASGKSQLLRTIAGSIALTHSCADVHLYVIDGGGGQLSPVAELPHCGTVVTPAETDRLTRLIARLSQEISLRRELLARLRFNSISDQRAAASADQRLPHIVLLVDRWEACSGASGAGTLASVLTEILSEGANLGMYLVMTGSPALLTEPLAVMAQDKLVFELANKADYGPLGLSPRTLPADFVAGRGFHVDAGTETQVALLDGDADEGGQAAALRALADMARDRDASVELSRRPFQVDLLVLVGERFHVGDAQGHPVGREDILAWLRDRHASGGCVALLGPRRAGKTWILTELKRRLVRDGSVHVQQVVVPKPSASVDSPDALACMLDRAMRTSASPAERLLDSALSHSGSGDRLVYLLDEVGRLVDYHPAAVSWLRDLGQAGAWIVYTGTEKDWHQVVRWALTAPGSSFGNDVNAVPVGPIGYHAALTFLTGTAANLRVHMTERTADAIIELTGPWPFYLQVVGDAVVRQVQAEDRRPLTDQQALHGLVQRRLLDEWTLHFRGRWAEVGTAGRAALLDQPGDPPVSLAPAQRDDLRDVGLLRPGDEWLEDRPFFDWISRNATSLRDGERPR